MKIKILILLILSFSVLKAQNNTYFIENKGQWSSEVKYLAKMNGMDAWILDNSVVFNFYKAEYRKNTNQIDWEQNNFSENHTIGHVIKMEFDYANTKLETHKFYKSNTYFNFFLNDNPKHWKSKVYGFKEVVVKDIYNGVDIQYYFDNGYLRYDLNLDNANKAKQIRIKFSGQNDLDITSDNDLVLSTNIGDILFKGLKAFHINNGKKEVINCNYKLLKSNVLQFNVESSNQDNKIIIDPFIFSSVQGDGQIFSDQPKITIDKNKNVYSLMPVIWNGLPTTEGAYKSYGTGIVVGKLSSDGRDLMFRTYIGRSGQYKTGGIELDSYGNVIVYGSTNSRNHPTTTGVVKERTKNWYYDGFISKLNPEGTELLMSTYFGGTYTDDRFSLTLDNDNNIYLSGITFSKDIPVTDNAIFKERTVFEYNDCFVSKLNSDATQILSSTYIIGNYIEYISDLEVNQNGQLILTGWTYSSDFPITDDAYDKIKGNANNDSADVFLMMLNSDLSNIDYSTYFGGGMSDRAYTIALDEFDNIAIAGFTMSEDFPVTGRAYDTQFNWDYDAFVSKFSKDGKELFFSTYFGSEHNDWIQDLDFDIHNNLYLIGAKQLNSKIAVLGNKDTLRTDSLTEFKTIIGRINNDYNDVTYYTLFGDTLKSSNFGTSIIVDELDDIYIAGIEFWGFPVTKGTFADSVRPPLQNGEESEETAGGYMYICKMNFKCGDFSFNYPYFENTQNFSLIGDAELVDSRIKLTKSDFWRRGALWNTNPLSIKAGFSTEFQFSIANGVNRYTDEKLKGADGIAFVVQSNSPYEIGRAGEGIGFGGIKNSLAIEFDMFNNINIESGAYNIADSSENHIAIFVNGGDGEYPIHASENCLAKFDNPFDIIPDGRTYYVKIEYWELFGSLQIFLDTTANFEDPQIMTYLGLDMSEYVNFDDSGNAWVGFSSATGIAYQEHNILGWEFCPFEQYGNISSTNSLNNNKNISFNFELYPNPARENIQLKFNSKNSTKIDAILYDYLGKEITHLYSGFISQGQNVINCSIANVHKGLYFLRISSNKNTIAKQLIID